MRVGSFIIEKKKKTAPINRASAIEKTLRGCGVGGGGGCGHYIAGRRGDDPFFGIQNQRAGKSRLVRRCPACRVSNLNFEVLYAIHPRATAKILCIIYTVHACVYSYTHTQSANPERAAPVEVFVNDRAAHYYNIILYNIREQLFICV